LKRKCQNDTARECGGQTRGSSTTEHSERSEPIPEDDSDSDIAGPNVAFLWPLRLAKNHYRSDRCSKRSRSGLGPSYGHLPDQPRVQTQGSIARLSPCRRNSCSAVHLARRLLPHTLSSEKRKRRGQVPTSCDSKWMELCPSGTEIHSKSHEPISLDDRRPPRVERSQAKDGYATDHSSFRIWTPDRATRLIAERVFLASLVRIRPSTGNSDFRRNS